MNLDVLGHAVEAIRAGRARIERDPYPHLVVKDVLPKDIYVELESILPTTEYIADRGDDEKIEQNTTYLRTSDRSLEDESLLPVWREFIETNTCRKAFENAIEIWGADIAERHPDLEANFGKPLEDFTTARRSGSGDSPANRRADVMLDCQFGVNTPVEAVGAPRGPHVDRGAKLFSALLYFRDEKDDSTGGEYELFSLPKGAFPKSKMKSVPDRYIETVKRVPYATNSLVMWMNTPDAVHAVAPRSVTPFPRRYIAISGECFGGAMPSAYFSHFPEWDSAVHKIRSVIGI